MRPRTEIRTRGGEARCDVCWGGPVVAVCSGCRHRLCRAHDTILDPMGVVPFGRAARIDRTAWHTAAPSQGPTRPATSPPDVGPDVEPDDAEPDPPSATTSDPDAPEGAEGESPSGKGTPTVDDWRTLRLPRGVAGRLDAEWGYVPPPMESDDDWNAADRQARPQDRHLCPRCVPLDRGWHPEVVGACLTGAVAAGAFASGVVVVAGVLGGLALVRVGGHLVRSRTRRRRDLPLFPAADPQFRRPRMTETVTAEATLDAAQNYVSTTKSVAGAVEVDASWSRVEANTGAELARAADVERITAGHVLLQGPGALTVREDPDQTRTETTGNSLVTLTPRATGTHHLTGPWAVKVAYDPDRERAERAVELWVTPTIAPDSGRRVLELDVSWCTRGEERYDPGLRLKKLDLVRVAIPRTWGRIDGSSHADIATISRDEDHSVVEWTNVRVERRTLRGVPMHFGAHAVDEEEDIVRFTQGRTRGTIHLSVRMMSDIPPDATLAARVEARFLGAASGLTGASFHYAGGGQRPENRRPAVVDGPGIDHPEESEYGHRNVRPTTRYLLDAALDLKGLRYQAVRGVPDRDQPDDEQGAAEFPGVAPDHDTVARLVEALGDAKYYVKRTVENRPQLGHTAGTTARSWDIGGRFYEGVHPIDFDLQLTGEEPIGSGAESVARTAGARCRMTVHVRGAHASAVTHDRVVDGYRQLWVVVRGVLGTTEEQPAPSRDDRDDTPAKERACAAVRQGCRRGEITEAAMQDLLDRIEAAFERPEES
ncbi:hypothetical protein [Actinomycetospora aeridis]|uniref:Uncharacterized protein n=1 Tax=Actinomycetospora aeridis TaxID=3129231 RepID=A0ABU8N6F5_9PSEU